MDKEVCNVLGHITSMKRRKGWACLGWDFRGRIKLGCSCDYLFPGIQLLGCRWEVAGAIYGYGSMDSIYT
jgi:hypothetical protein